MIEEKYFLVQVKHTNSAWEKGVVVKDSLNSARQSFHAYLGAYGYGQNPQTDYVLVQIIGDTGAIYDMTIDDRREPAQVEEG